MGEPVSKACPAANRGGLALVVSRSGPLVSVPCFPIRCLPITAQSRPAVATSGWSRREWLDPNVPKAHGIGCSWCARGGSTPFRPSRWVPHDMRCSFLASTANAESSAGLRGKRVFPHAAPPDRQSGSQPNRYPTRLLVPETATAAEMRGIDCNSPSIGATSHSLSSRPASDHHCDRHSKPHRWCFRPRGE